MNEASRMRLREAANNLIQAIGGVEQRALAVAPFIDNLLMQAQSRLPGHAPPVPQQMSLAQVQRLTGVAMNPEKFRIAVRLAGFNPKDNFVTKEITRRFGANLKQGELINIAQVIAENAQIKLDRDARRRKNVLLRWFEEHWVQITPYLDYIVLEDDKDERAAPGKEEEETAASETV